MKPPTIGLLPLYLELYDTVLPTLAAEVAPFVEVVAGGLRAGGAAVIGAPLVCQQRDCAAAVARFEAAGVDAIVVLHLAYSPSLESAAVLSGTALPVVLLATSPDRDFGPAVDPQRLLTNHGVHGLQDLAAVLRRMGKPYQVVAGHLTGGVVLPRVLSMVGAARAACALRTMRVLRIGQTFPGMGDFAVSDEQLHRTLGVTVETITPGELGPAINTVPEAAVTAELAADHQRFRVACDPAVHARSVRVGLGLRATLERGGFGAFSLNFLAFQDSAGPVNTVPFLECCHALERGLGYAGEGDVLTAALVGALAQGFGPTNFTEIFCPDWAGQTLFLSHMGEFNPAFAAGRPCLREKAFPFTPALAPATLTGVLRPGPATLVNLAPGPQDRFRLITAAVEVLPDGTHPARENWIRGWIRPGIPLPAFLEEFSRLGATHHSALVGGDQTQALAAFSEFLRLEHCPLGRRTFP